MKNTIHISRRKIYDHISNNKIQSVILNDVKKLEIGKNLYGEGKYIESFQSIQKIMNKYKNYTIYDSFFIDLLFSYSNVCSILNKPYPYFYKINEIINNLDTIQISKAQKIFC